MMQDETRRWLDEQFGGDAETVNAVWNEYLVETAAKLVAAQGAYEAADYPMLDRLAHTLKGNALMIGDQRIVAAAIALRDAAKASDDVGVGKALGRLAALDGENRA